MAAVPETVKRLGGAGVSVIVESGAGEAAGYPDEAYAEAGAEFGANAGNGWSAADIICTVQAPSPEDAAAVAPDAILIGLLAPHRNLDLVRTVTDRKATALAMELVPRITRAQPMDALSSQANVAGYRAVTQAAWLLEKHFPLSMTAAGTIRAATVVVLGAGVAGLQAIATARRLGAVVRANDIRTAAKGEVESLGAEFITIEEEVDAEGSGGYAKEVGEDFLTRQRRILGDHLEQAHAVITTAFVPGRPAPTLVTAEMVERMPPGSVLIDLAAAEGGNCEVTDGDRTIEHHGVRVIGAPNLPSTIPGEASMLYARNVFELTSLLLHEGEIRVDTEDEIVASTLLTRGGEVVHGPTAELLGDQEPRR